MRPTAEQIKLSARNRRILAKRQGWPEGGVAACEKLEQKFPGFEVFWFRQNRSARTEFNREAGFYAWRAGEQPGQMWGDTWRGRKEWYGATPEELRAQLLRLTP